MTIERPSRNVAIINDTSGSAHFGCTLVMRELYRHLNERNIKTAWNSYVGQDWKPGAKSIPRSPNLHGVIVNGEGTIHHTAKRIVARRLLEVGPFAKNVLKVPAFLINATIHELAPEHADYLCAFEGIYVRDSRSKAELSEHGINSIVVPDLTLGAIIGGNNLERSGCCGSDSVETIENNALRRLCQEKGWPFWPLSYRFRPFSKRRPNVNADYPALLKARLGSADPVRVFANYLSRRELHVTGRYHAVAYCIATRTPFLAVESNTPKISSLVADVFGHNNRIVNVASLNRLDFGFYARWDSEESQRAEKFCKRGRSDIASMFDRIANNLA